MLHKNLIVVWLASPHEFSEFSLPIRSPMGLQRLLGHVFPAALPHRLCCFPNSSDLQASFCCQIVLSYFPGMCSLCLTSANLSPSVSTCLHPITSSSSLSTFFSVLKIKWSMVEDHCFVSHLIWPSHFFYAFLICGKSWVTEWEERTQAYWFIAHG